jgi:hypothetical protein
MNNEKKQEELLSGLTELESEIDSYIGEIKERIMDLDAEYAKDILVSDQEIAAAIGKDKQ